MMPRYLPPLLRPAHIQLGRIPTGYAGTLRTLEHIKELIRRGAKDFYVRQKAIDILMMNGVQPKQYLAEIQTLFRWVQHNIRYTKDPFQVEVLHSARRMLELRAGDCDDMTILLGSMLKSIGHPVRLVLSGFNPGNPEQFSHIYLEVLYKNRWIPLDATMPFAAGWAPTATSRRVFPIEKQPRRRAAQPLEHKPLPAKVPLGRPVRSAERLYRRFRRFAPDRHLRIRYPRLIPSTVVHLGSLLGLIYRADKGDGKRKAYIHFMEKPPLLVSNPEGNQLYILGGKYKVTGSGIEG